MARLIQFKRGTKVNLPTLVTGEPAWVTDEGKLYIGNDGVNIPIARGDHTHTPASIGAIPTTEKGAINGVATLDGNKKVLASQLPTMNYDTIGSAAAVEQKLDTFIAKKGVVNGLAELNSEGKVPNSQLPSYVDDVVEFTTKALFPSTGETGKIYVDTTTNLAWRWSGSIYVEISPSIALGITSATALRGDWGKTAYDHSQITSGNPHGSTAADVGAVPTSRTINSKPLNANVVLVASDVGAVPTTRTINTKPLSANITLTAGDVSAMPALWNGAEIQGPDADEIILISPQGTTMVLGYGTLDVRGPSAEAIRIRNVAPPLQSTDVANKGYADSMGDKATYYGTCSTAAAVAAKVVDCPGFVLATGAKISVKFTNVNTVANVTIDVNGTGAKTVVDQNGAVITAGSYPSASLLSGVIPIIYDGTYWVVQGRMALGSNLPGLLRGTDVISANNGYFAFYNDQMNITGDLFMTGCRISEVGEPEYDDDATTKGYVDQHTLLYTAAVVLTTAWTADTTYSAQGYGFRASITCAGTTSAHQPSVVFSVADAISGNFAPVAESYAGGVYIYCKEKPTATVTIPSISCIKGA